MPGRKRSEIQNSTQSSGVIAEPVGRRPRRSASTPGEYRQALCPVCGTGHGYKRVKAQMLQGGEMNAIVNYWEWLNQREKELGYENKPPFGTIQETGRGKGQTFQPIGNFGPDDDPDGYFPLVKARMILAFKRWLARGWLELSELEPD